MFTNMYMLQRRGTLFNSLINEVGLESCGRDLLAEHKT